MVLSRPEAPVEVVYGGPDEVSILLSGGVAAAVVYGRQVAEILCKLIPDSATGALGTIRKIAAVIAGYTRNNDR